VIWLKLVQTCGACPEQYNVLRGDEQVGYLRLRHGEFYAACPDSGGQIVYQAEPRGDGTFEDDERDAYLAAALTAIEEWLSSRTDAKAPALPDQETKRHE
jgi:hypothetical protein